MIDQSVSRRIAFAFTVLLYAVLAGLTPAEAAPRHLTVAGADGVPLAVTVEGPDDAPPILFIHGLGQSSLSWSAQFNSALAQSHKLVAFDLRGHGASGKPWTNDAYTDAKWAEDLAAVITATGIRRPLVVAWSYGTWVINDYVRLRGADNIAGIVYVGATGGIAQPPMDALGASVAAYGRIRQMQVAPDLAEQIEGVRQSGAYLFKKAVPDDVRQRSFEVSLMLPAYVRQALYVRRFDSQGVETRLNNLPILFLGGREDGAYAGDVSDQIHRSLPRAQICLYDGVGHSPFLEEAARFNTDIEAFASKIREPVRHSGQPRC